jgi:hypothetical protein
MADWAGIESLVMGSHSAGFRLEVRMEDLRRCRSSTIFVELLVSVAASFWTVKLAIISRVHSGDPTVLGLGAVVQSDGSGAE